MSAPPAPWAKGLSGTNPLGRHQSLAAGSGAPPIADRCPHIQVSVVDLNAERIAAWNDPDLSQLPVYEPGLAEVVGRCRGRNLHVSTAVEPAIASADMVFIAVNTPTKSRGLRTVAAHATGHTVVGGKSTLPVRTAETVKAPASRCSPIPSSSRKAPPSPISSSPTAC